MINAATTLSKVDTLNATVLSIATISLLSKPFNTDSFYLVIDGLVNNLITYIEDSNSIITKSLNIL